LRFHKGYIFRNKEFSGRKMITFVAFLSRGVAKENASKSPRI